MTSSPIGAENALLRSLSSEDLKMLTPLLVAVDLPLRHKLEPRKALPTDVFFIGSGICSVVANSDRPLEIGLIGREGMTALAVLTNPGATTLHESYMQVAGHGWSIPVSDMLGCLEKSRPLHRHLLKYVHGFMGQVADTALANGRATMSQRLARWLLMVHDRVVQDELHLTHEFLSVMLGVQRSGVTLAVQELERKACIAQRRSFITVLDRAGLEEQAGNNYVRPH